MMKQGYKQIKKRNTGNYNNGKTFSSTYQPTQVQLEKRKETFEKKTLFKLVADRIGKRIVKDYSAEFGISEIEIEETFIAEQILFILSTQEALAKKSVYKTNEERQDSMLQSRHLENYKNSLFELFPIASQNTMKKLNGEQKQLTLFDNFDFKMLSFKQLCQFLDKDLIPYDKQIEMMEFAFQEGTKMILGARSYGKSIFITTRGIVYKLLQNNNLTFLIVCKADSKAKELINSISRDLKALGFELDLDNSTTINLKNHIKGGNPNVKAISLHTEKRGNHVDYIICDDIVSPQDTGETEREKVFKEYGELLSLGNLNPETKQTITNITFIGQPVHSRDLYAYLRGIKSVKKLELPYGTIPELDVDLDTLKKERTERDIKANYFLEIDETIEKQPFKDCLVGNIEEIEKNFLIKNEETFGFIDPSMKGNDYTSFSICFIRNNIIFILGFMWQLSWDKVIEEIIEIRNRFNVKFLEFETNGLGDYPVNLLREKGINVIGKNTYTSKEKRIQNAGIYSSQINLIKLNDNDIFYSKNRDFIEQVKNYEVGNSKHDDAPDSLASSMIFTGQFDLDGSIKKNHDELFK